MLAAVVLLALAPIPVSDSRIAYIGRFDRTNPAVAICQWPASEVRLNVSGAKLEADIEETERGQDFIQVVVDGKPSEVLKATPGNHTYTVNLGANGSHLVELVKRTEPFVGALIFHSFAVPGGGLMRAQAKRRQIEIVGDSISCGFGNEGANQNEPFRPETENAYLTYGSIAARSVNADVTIIAWSGRKMWPDNTTPEIYDLNLPTVPTSTYDFKGPAPQAVVINLATNDFGKVNPDEKGWTNAYEAFVRRIWTHYPHAHVYATMGGMMSDDYPVGNKSLSTLRSYLTHMVARVNDPRLTLLEFAQQRMEDGIGSSWHPNLKTHQLMAARLIEALRRDLGW